MAVDLVESCTPFVWDVCFVDNIRRSVIMIMISEVALSYVRGELLYMYIFSIKIGLWVEISNWFGTFGFFWWFLKN